MLDCNPSSTPADELRLSSDNRPQTDEQRSEMYNRSFREIAGSLLYLTLTRPDIAYAVNQISHFVSNPGLKHWITAKEY